jgi:hypothetical protein
MPLPLPWPLPHWSLPLITFWGWICIGYRHLPPEKSTRITTIRYLLSTFLLRLIVSFLASIPHHGLPARPRFFVLVPAARNSGHRRAWWV